MESLNFVDIILIIIFFCSIIIGFGRGFVREVISLGTFILAFIVAIYFTTPLAAMITNSTFVQNMINQASGSVGSANASQSANYVAMGIAFGLLFLGTIIVGAIFGWILNLAFQSGMLGFGNRLLGGIFGFVRGYLLNLVLVFVVQLTPMSNQSWWQQSYFVNAYQPEVQWLASLVSPTLDNLKAKLGQSLQGVNSEIQNISN